MLNQFASVLAAATLAGCSTEPVTWSVPVGSVADPGYQAAAFTPPANMFAHPIAVPESAVMNHGAMNHGAMHHAAATAPASVQGTGVVRSVDAATGSVKLAHDAIPSIGWPKMVMSFKVQPDVDLSKLKADEKVRFTLQPAGGGDYMIASIAPAGMDHSQHGGAK
jgi:Cu/Ag efflux protein CusF